MSDLLTAAKAVISAWDDQYRSIDMRLKNLRAAVERAENPPADYNEWTANNAGKVLSAYEVWTAAQQAERERIKDIIKTVGVQCDNGTWVKCETIMDKIHDVS